MSDAAWLKWRQGGIGGSDIGAVLGVSPFKTPFDVWTTKFGEPEQIDTPDTRRGIHLEDGIARWYAQERGCSIYSAEHLEHRAEPWARCTPDREAIETRGSGQWLVSIKAPRRGHGWGEPGTEDVPLAYYLQCQWEMMIAASLRMACAGRSEIVALIHGELAIYPIAANAEVQQAALERARAFWVEHVIANVPPPLDAGETVGPWLARRYESAPAIEAVEATPEVSLLAEEWRELDGRIAGLEARREAVKNQVRDAIGMASAARVQGPFGQIGWKADKNGKRSLRARWR